jgi:hybrid cluster-associated redox disulfide protein
MMAEDLSLSELMVADILNRWPQAIPVFLKHRMSCVGCLMAPFETLSDAARIYKIPYEAFVEELDHAIRNESFTPG